ncbi:MAG: GGDEF domain-containing protein, partial [Chloroflexi bacterium]
FFLNSARLELELETARTELELVAGTDALTSLYNRRRFNEQAEIEFRRAQRYGVNLSIAMLDADDLKLINDTYGHDSGDRVLIFISGILRSEVRPFDMVARYGGDEFVILLVDTDKEEARLIAERIRRDVEEMPVVVNAFTLSIRLSVGVTAVEPQDTDLAMTLKRTDHALYHAKQQGRNRVMVA